MAAVLKEFHLAVGHGRRPAYALAAAKAVLEEENPLAIVVGAIQCHGRW